MRASYHVFIRVSYRKYCAGCQSDKTEQNNFSFDFIGWQRIHLFQVRDQWWTLVNVVVILRVPQKHLFFKLAGQLLVGCLGL
jgi:hypothetical protein